MESRISKTSHIRKIGVTCQMKKISEISEMIYIRTTAGTRKKSNISRRMR